MDKKSKILLWVFAVLLVGSVVATFWRIMIWRDYIIEAQVDCDPYSEKCFVWECDPESIVEGEACVGDPETDAWYFKVAKRNAGRIPLCDPNTDENCQPMLCEEDEMECEEMLCTEDQLEAQYASSCVDPIAFTAENLVEEEEATECAEGDTECETAPEEEACAEGDEECAASLEANISADEAVVNEDLAGEDAGEGSIPGEVDAGPSGAPVINDIVIE